MPEFVVEPRVSQTMIIPGAVKPKHLEIGLAAVKFGNAADRPEEGGTYPIFFALDTHVLSIWNGSAWYTTTLT